MSRTAVFGLSAAAAAAFVALAGPPAWAKPTDAQVRQQVIRASIAAYPGSCPCPYSTDRAGRRCGARSAWSRPGGYAPKCYARDVTAADIAAHRR